ncbi:hypothetical protein CWI36_0048p0040 [Hamiltosporidium magnivora]|uniref:Uncharacterized protein n=1 Tax=Hamiltosporidium magnivora TaxID=148818 RepID=A0A4Q9LP01_9MICR|nr:hypothetical protein CWI36_0048p0040 [Hamiltosporidium magnivora]
MFFISYLGIFRNFVKSAIESLPSNYYAEEYKIDDHIKRHNIGAFWCEDIMGTPSTYLHPSTTLIQEFLPCKAEHVGKSTDKYSIPVSNNALDSHMAKTSQNPIPSNNTHACHTLSGIPRFSASDSTQTPSCMNTLLNIDEKDNENTFLKEIPKEYYYKTDLQCQISEKIKKLTQICKRIRKDKINCTSYSDILCFLDDSYRIRNLFLKNIFMNNCKLFWKLRNIEAGMKEYWQDERILKEVAVIFKARIDQIEIAKKNCAILSFFPGLIFIKDFINKRFTNMSLNERPMISIYYGCKIIESILHYDSLKFTELNHSFVYGENSEYPKFRLCRNSLQITKNYLLQILNIVRYIYEALEMRQIDQKMTKLIKSACYYLKNDFRNNRYTKNIITRSLLDLVFLFDEDSIEYIIEYNSDTCKSNLYIFPLFRSFQQDIIDFSVFESRKFIKYYLEIFENKIFKEYINIPEQKYERHISYLNKIRENISQNLTDIEINTIAFEALEKTQIFIHYYINVKVNSMIFTDEYKEKMLEAFIEEINYTE